MPKPIIGFLGMADVLHLKFKEHNGSKKHRKPEIETDDGELIDAGEPPATK
jgi:hypothetical protein